MNQLKHLTTWLDIHGLFLFSCILLVFIPLFPKIPIFEVLPGYIVRARPEDILIGITAIIWIKDAYKQRFKVRSSYFWLVWLYTISGVLSIILGTILVQSIPAQLLHIGTSTLHLFRYLEYFSLFFFLYSSVKTIKQLKIVFVLLTMTVLAVVLYGFGQEYFHFPLYSTMNREYSKGVTLYLQEGARPQSTFAGHYDLAAYLVIVLPILFSLALSSFEFTSNNLKTIFKRKNYISAILHIVHLLGAWMLITSGSKTALLAYIVSVSIVMIQYLKQLGSIKLQIKWGTTFTLTAVIILVVFLSFFGQKTRDTFISLIKTVTNKSELPTNPDSKPEDLVGDGVVYKQVTVTQADGTQKTEWIEEKSTWSNNALKYGLSMGIRLDTLWPNALKGFSNNPLFGNGYATLASMESEGEYSYAESTDNNFLRTLGETGLIGFITFYGFIIIITCELLKSNSKSGIANALKMGFIGSIVGIFINATYIDVFAASKVAYTFWSFAGLSLAFSKTNPSTSIQKIGFHFSKHWAIYLSCIMLMFLLHKNPFHKYALIKDLSVSNLQIESVTKAQCFIKIKTFDLCIQNQPTQSGNVSFYSLFLVPFYMVNRNPLMFYYLNISLVFGVILTLYLAVPKLLIIFQKRTAAPALIFASLLLYLLIATIFQISQSPLSNLSLFSFIVLIPSLILIYTVLIHTINFRLAYLTQISALLAASLFLVNQNFSDTFFNQFRNNTISNRYTMLDLVNTHFDTYKYLNRESDFYLISAVSPYYIDLFSNGHYKYLPLSEQQPYFVQADNVYPPFNSTDSIHLQLSNLIRNKNIYATDLETNASPTFSESFETLKNNFDLKYVAIGCEDSCSLFQVLPKSEEISPSPISVSSKKLQLSSLMNSYSFAIISNRFEPRSAYDQDSSIRYESNEFAQFLNSEINSFNFVAVTGDIYHDNGNQNSTLFSPFFRKMPILYTAGNKDLYESKLQSTKDNYFFTDSEFFIFLSTDEHSQISQDQQLFLYNTLLKLEKLPNIKSIFIISHNLNWQDKSNPNNVINDLEKKLKRFPDQIKYIISSNHTATTDEALLREELTVKHITDDKTNTQYLSSFVRNWKNDSFLEFSVSADNTVNINYKIKNQNF